jgi:hypothetical protein
LFDDDKSRLHEAKDRVVAELAVERLLPHPTKCRLHACREGIAFSGSDSGRPAFEYCGRTASIRATDATVAAEGEGRSRGTDRGVAGDVRVVSVCAGVSNQRGARGCGMPGAHVLRDWRRVWRPLWVGPGCAGRFVERRSAVLPFRQPEPQRSDESERQQRFS